MHLIASTFTYTAPAEEVPVTKAPVGSIVVRKLNIEDNKAVIPLAVGLVLVLLLLLGVVFRLKTSRRRRTKAFLTDDADYLINGMYL
jgi:Flp pilus assembly protein TadB